VCCKVLQSSSVALALLRSLSVCNRTACYQLRLLLLLCLYALLQVVDRLLQQEDLHLVHETARCVGELRTAEAKLRRLTEQTQVISLLTALTAMMQLLCTDSSLTACYWRLCSAGWHYICKLAALQLESHAVLCRWTYCTLN
jgi:hypothetical protein